MILLSHCSFAFSSDGKCEHYQVQFSNNYISYDKFAKLAQRAISEEQPHEISSKYWSLAQNIVSRAADIPTINEAFCEGKLE